jgi:hypothetical protein
MSHSPASQTDFGATRTYQIRVKGQLGVEWADWFGGLTIVQLDDGDTLITGPLIDQAALHGLLKMVRDLGLTLVSVNQIAPQVKNHNQIKGINMKTLQKSGGFAALYLAIAYLIGMVLFLVVLDYPSLTDPAQRVTLLVEKQGIIFSSNLLMYVFFGIGLIVLALALYDRLKPSSPAIIPVACAIGMIWAGCLIASGMVSNAGIAPVVALYAKDPAQGALTWQAIESVANGLGNANGEILGGLFTLLVSLAALRAGKLPQGLNILGLLVGAVGISSIFPGLIGLSGVFGLSQIIWFVWLGIVLLRSNPGKTA